MKHLYSRSGRDENDHAENANGPATAETPSAARRARRTPGASSTTVDRNTSVRSVMTLPPYRPKPLENESVLGREGERDGIDVVIELPSAENEEELREEEMDSLFQIRVARRRQIDEREARREARRVARARNDQAALQAIREQARIASESNVQEIEALRQDHIRAKESRQRAVSSVSYADLGVARHDGTRIRANSSESERVGLLSDAASIGASVRSPSNIDQAFSHSNLHQRGRSASSVLSINTTHSDDGQLQLQPQTSARSRASSVGQHTQAGSSPELVDAADADLGEGELPLQSPPGYDEVSLSDLTPAISRSESPYPEPPPDYTPGPSESRNRRLSANIADLAAQTSADEVAAAQHSSTDGQESRRSSRLSGIPQLPSLRLARLPQIVIEPSSATPTDREP